MAISSLMRDDRAYTRAAGLGAVTGLRSMVGPALLSAAVQSDGPLRGYAAGREGGVAASVLGSKAVLILLGLAAAGELVGDKLPFVPGRIQPPVFAERLVAGALVGAAIGDLGGRSPLATAAVGSAASGAAAAVGYLVRTGLPKLTGIPQQAFGVVEDGVALWLGWRALGLRRR
jgi:uncharacterized membrane protein